MLARRAPRAVATPCASSRVTAHAVPRRTYAPPPPPPPRVGTHPPSEIRRIWLRNGAQIDLRLVIPGKEAWLKRQKPRKITVKKRVISEDLLKDVGELPDKPAEEKKEDAKPAPIFVPAGTGMLAKAAAAAADQQKQQKASAKKPSPQAKEQGGGSSKH